MVIPLLSLNDRLINQGGMGHQLSLAHESSQKFRVALVILFLETILEKYSSSSQNSRSIRILRLALERSDTF